MSLVAILLVTFIIMTITNWRSK